MSFIKEIKIENLLNMHVLYNCYNFNNKIMYRILIYKLSLSL